MTGADTGAPRVRHPVVVVGLPCYNEERYLQQAIDSLRAQTWSDFAVLVSDNASSDRTGEIARAACAADPRFTYYRQPDNIGAVRNFEFLADHTDSPFLLWFGGHDILKPTFLERHVAALRADPTASVSFNHSGWIDEEGVFFGESKGTMHRLGPSAPIRYFATPRHNDLCVEFNGLIRRRALEGVRFVQTWGPDLIVIAHLAYRGRMHCVPEPLYLRRDFRGRNHQYMERLSGDAEAKVDFAAFLAAFMAQFEITARRHPLRRPAAILGRRYMRYQLGLTTHGASAWLLRTLGAARRRWRG